MSVYNVGIIGYGGFGEFLKNSWEKLENIKVVAVADEIPAKDPGGDIRFYENWQELAKENVDIISIATPPSSHAEIACELMRAGKNVLIEKPLATNLEDAQKIKETMIQTGKIATVDFMLRFNPIIEALEELSSDNTLGQIRHVNVENYAQDQMLPPEHWFWDKDIAGGILIEHAVHFIDIVHGIAKQRLLYVNGLSVDRNERQEDQVFAAACYDQGLIATHYHSFARPSFFEDTSMRFNYDLAQIDIHGWIPLSGTIEALVTENTKNDLYKLPGLKILESKPTLEADDLSRPKGWGALNKTHESRELIRSGGVEYQAKEIIKAQFEIHKDKQSVYAECVQKMIKDMIRKIENPDHNLRVSIDDGISSLEVAYKATHFGRDIKK